MASIQKVLESPVNSSGQFLNLMAFGKPKVKYQNLSIASHIPKRYLTLANANLLKLSKEKQTEYKNLLKQNIVIDSAFLSYEDSELCTLAKITSENYQYYLSSRTDFKAAYIDFSERLARQGFRVPDVKKHNYKSACLRLGSNKWWRKTLRTAQARTLETEHVRMGHVGRPSKQLYVSNESISRHDQKRIRNANLLESMEAKNELGYTAVLQDLADVSTANPELRRNELMTRLRGLEEYADSKKLVGDFYTLTCPASMHRYSSQYKSGKYVRSFLNKSYDGTTPRQAQAYLNKQWQKIRAELKRQDLPLLGMRVAEPHHDGTPHWHLLFFINKKHRSQIRQIFRQYALEVNPNEKGAQKHRFTAIKINKKSKTGKPQSAVGYIAKYISKNIAFTNKHAKTTEGLKPIADNYENDGDTVGNVVNRVQCWASLWGIRQFQQIGGERITIWRELRRIRKDDGQDIPAGFKDAHKHADKGDYFQFLKTCIKNKKINIVRKFSSLNDDPKIEIIDTSTGEVVVHADREHTNIYEEIRPAPIIGLEIQGAFIQTRWHEWTLKTRRVSALGLVSITVPTH